MHYCSDIQEKLLDYALGELGTAHEAAGVLHEADACPRCKAEKAALEQTFALYQQAADFQEPRRAEWQTLENKITAGLLTPPKAARRWRNLFAASIRIPVPALAAAVLAVCGLVYAVSRPSQQENIAVQTAPPPSAPEAPAPIIIEKAASEKIIVQERVVTKKVYVERKARQNNETTVKSVNNKNEVFSPLNLAEFKPLKPSAPVVSKGDAPDEK